MTPKTRATFRQLFSVFYVVLFIANYLLKAFNSIRVHRFNYSYLKSIYRVVQHPTHRVNSVDMVRQYGHAICTPAAVTYTAGCASRKYNDNNSNNKTISCVATMAARPGVVAGGAADRYPVAAVPQPFTYVSPVASFPLSAPVGDDVLYNSVSATVIVCARPSYNRRHVSSRAWTWFERDVHWIRRCVLAHVQLSFRRLVRSAVCAETWFICYPVKNDNVGRSSNNNSNNIAMMVRKSTPSRIDWMRTARVTADRKNREAMKIWSKNTRQRIITTALMSRLGWMSIVCVVCRNQRLRYLFFLT